MCHEIMYPHFHFPIQKADCRSWMVNSHLQLIANSAKNHQNSTEWHITLHNEQEQLPFWYDTKFPYIFAIPIFHPIIYSHFSFPHISLWWIIYHTIFDTYKQYKMTILTHLHTNHIFNIVHFYMPLCFVFKNCF